MARARSLCRHSIIRRDAREPAQRGRFALTVVRQAAMLRSSSDPSCGCSRALVQATASGWIFATQFHAALPALAYRVRWASRIAGEGSLFTDCRAVNATGQLTCFRSSGAIPGREKSMTVNDSQDSVMREGGHADSMERVASKKRAMAARAAPRRNTKHSSWSSVGILGCAPTLEIAATGLGLDARPARSQRLPLPWRRRGGRGPRPVVRDPPFLLARLAAARPVAYRSPMPGSTCHTGRSRSCSSIRWP